MKNEEMRNRQETIDLLPEMLLSKKEIIVYGASAYGEIAYWLLDSINVRPNYYCDGLIKTKEYMGIEVLRPEELRRHKDAWVIIASADYFFEIKEVLEELKIQQVCNMSFLLKRIDLKTDVLSNRARDIYKNKNNYIDVAQQSQDDESLNFTRIQFVVSERCSLKCRDCTHLMQYYQHPQNVDIEKYRDAFQRIIGISDSISEVRILGGEPFMNKDLYKILEWWKDCDKIGVFTIYTNGTIIPEKKCIEALKANNCRIRISDYGHNHKKIEKTTEVFKKNKLEYYINKFDKWADAGGLEKRNRKREENERIFANCYERNCITFLHGKLHRCPRSAHAMNIGAMPDTLDDYVDVARWEGSDIELVHEIKRLQKKKVITACDYCDGPSTKEFNIPAAIQTKEPLSF